MINAEIVIDSVNWKKKLKNIDLFINKVLKNFTNTSLKLLFPAILL